jgi:hypothetical protein
VRKNWRSRNTKNAEPNRFCAHSGTWVEARPTAFHSRYTGTIVTAPGSIIVPSTSPNSTLRPRNRKCAKPKATIALDTVTAVAAASPTTMLLNSHSSIGAFSHTCT